MMLCFALAMGAGLGTTATTHTDQAPDRMPWPAGVVSNANDAHILTPRPPLEPRINGTSVFGARPDAPIRFKVPASGQHPITYEADLPPGLSIDAANGVIAGKLSEPGDHRVRVRATNSLGTDEATLTFRIGDQIGLTPPMGWNSWNCWGWRVTQQNVEDSARAMVERGLIDHGWTYINIDDTWQSSTRGGPFHAIQGNERFPDIAGLCSGIHEMGLKVGIYSTPWITSYAHYIGSSSDNADGAWDPSMKDEAFKRFGTHSFVANDAKQYAAWGIDYLKYDWHPNDPEHTQEMRTALDATGRDIIFSLSNSAPLESAVALSAASDLARTTGDIRDRWTKAGDWPYEEWAWGLIEIWDRHERWRRFTRPGFFPDADMLVVGEVSWTGTPAPSGLTPDEQYTHISLWSLWSSPLLIGCPIERLDRFTLSLLTNDEIIAVNQDPLGVMARTVRSEDDQRVVAKPMADGSIVVGLFNRSDTTRDVGVTWASLGIQGRASLRDLWSQRDLAAAEGEAHAAVNPHGVVMLRLAPAQGQNWTTSMLTSEPGKLYDASTPLKDGDRVVFFGDSITQHGGYIDLIRDQFQAAHPETDVAFINKGIGGNKIGDLLARVDRDVLPEKPTTVVVYIGINDVWHWEHGTGTTPKAYEQGLTKLLQTFKDRSIPVVLASPSLIGERPRGLNPMDARLDAYAEIGRRVGRRFGATLCDLRAPFFAYLETANTQGKDRGITTTDGVHMQPAGSRIIADAVADALARR